MSYLKQKAETSESPAAAKVSNFAPTEATLSTSAPPVATSLVKPVVKVEHEEEAKPSESLGPNVQIQVATTPEEAPVTKVVQFVPKFSKEMEARRQMRMAATRCSSEGDHSRAQSELLLGQIENVCGPTRIQLASLIHVSLYRHHQRLWPSRSPF
jgi:hypothetical protein